jgi:hypothetical protein
MVLGEILFGMASGMFNLALLYAKPSPDQGARCSAAALDVITRGFCEQSPVVKGLATSLFILLWLLQICESPPLSIVIVLTNSADGLFVTTMFSRQLLEGELENESAKIYAYC